jgi:hypothetical protein
MLEKEKPEVKNLVGQSLKNTVLAAANDFIYSLLRTFSTLFRPSQTPFHALPHHVTTS